MNVFRAIALACISAFCASAPAIAAIDNFEGVVGPELARLTAPESIAWTRLPDTSRTRSNEDTAPRGKRLSTFTPELQDKRLDQQLRYGYRRLGEQLAARLWDDPRGRRIRFDIEGRPGIGLVIPF